MDKRKRAQPGSPQRCVCLEILRDSSTSTLPTSTPNASLSLIPTLRHLDKSPKWVVLPFAMWT